MPARTFLVALAFLCLSGAAFCSPGTARAQEGAPRSAVTQPMAVMELFTSQGCSSCPAADAIFASHADRDDVLALAWHVDYWDYLGWRDPLAHPASTERQRLYARMLGEGVYTPQLIVNGVVEGVGHRRDDVRQMLAAARTAAERDGNGFVKLSVDRRGEGYHVSLAGAAATERTRVDGATLFLVWFDSRHEVRIPRGENAGRTVVYRNAVRGMQMLGSVSDGRLEVTLPFDALRRAVPGAKSCALVLQRTVDGAPGPIVGAAMLGDLSDR